MGPRDRPLWRPITVFETGSNWFGCVMVGDKAWMLCPGDLLDEDATAVAEPA